MTPAAALFAFFMTSAAAVSITVATATTITSAIATAVTSTVSVAMMLVHLLKEVLYFLFACFTVLNDVTTEQKVLACKRMVEVNGNLVLRHF